MEVETLRTGRKDRIDPEIKGKNDKERTYLQRKKEGLLSSSTSSSLTIMV
jgi:hypothetical protein